MRRKKQQKLPLFSRKIPFPGLIPIPRRESPSFFVLSIPFGSRSRRRGDVQLSHKCVGQMRRLILWDNWDLGTLSQTSFCSIIMGLIVMQTTRALLQLTPRRETLLTKRSPRVLSVVRLSVTLTHLLSSLSFPKQLSVHSADFETARCFLPSSFTMSLMSLFFSPD